MKTVPERPGGRPPSRGRRPRGLDCAHRDASSAGRGVLTRAGRVGIAPTAANCLSTWPVRAARPAHHQLSRPAAARLASNRAQGRESLPGESSRDGGDIVRCGQHPDIERLRVWERSAIPAVDAVPDLMLELSLPGSSGSSVLLVNASTASLPDRSSGLLFSRCDTAAWKALEVPRAEEDDIHLTRVDATRHAPREQRSCDTKSSNRTGSCGWTTLKILARAWRSSCSAQVTEEVSSTSWEDSRGA